VFPLEQTRPVGVAESEHPRLTNDEIIFEWRLRIIESKIMFMADFF